MSGTGSCFYHLGGLAILVKGLLLSDFVSVLGSIDLVLGEVDR